MTNIKTFRLIVWANLLFGLQNIYFYVHNDHILNIIIGCSNIGVWVFYRHYLWGDDNEKG